MRTNTLKGFTLVELLIVVVILVIVLGGGYLIFSAGQSTWFTTDVNIQLQENLRKTVERITMELRQSHIDHQWITQGATDGIKFSIPIVCKDDSNLINTDGDVARWGAPLIWGCTDWSCTDPDEDCLTFDYKYIEYRIDNDNQLVRRVLDSTSSQVREDIFAGNISDFQIQDNGGLISIDITAQCTTDMSRVLTAQTSVDVYLRN
jgi:prepilin-type N-terminal cleavage/methylation domain-containing protein